jgi:hypothetical protein
MFVFFDHSMKNVFYPINLIALVGQELMHKPQVVPTHFSLSNNIELSTYWTK